MKQISIYAIRNDTKSVHVFVTILKLSLIWCREEKGSEACVGQISQITISAMAAKVCTTEAGLTVRLRKEKTRTYHWLLHKKKQEIGILKSCWSNALAFITLP